MLKQFFLPRSTANKEIVKAIRHNKKYTTKKILKNSKNCKTLLFQKVDKTALIIPVTKQKEFIQVHLDKHFQLVKYLRKKRCFKNLPWIRLWHE